MPGAKQGRGSGKGSSGTARGKKPGGRPFPASRAGKGSKSRNAGGAPPKRSKR